MFQKIEAKGMLLLALSRGSLKLGVDEQSTSDPGAKEVGMVTLRIKQIERVAAKPANTIQDVPQSVLGKRKAGELCVG